MDLNIKDIINLKLTDFESHESYIEFIERDENWDNLANLKTDSDLEMYAKQEFVYSDWAEIWVLNGFLVARRARNSDKVMINPEFSKYLLSNTINYLNLYNEEKIKEEESKIKLDMDSILDRINQVGFENLSDKEKKFLKDSN